jgi:hypothetical protein
LSLRRDVELWLLNKVEILKLWRLLEIDRIYLAVWGHEPLRTRGGYYGLNMKCLVFWTLSLQLFFVGSGNFRRWGLAGRSRSPGAGPWWCIILGLSLSLSASCAPWGSFSFPTWSCSIRYFSHSNAKINNINANYFCTRMLNSVLTCIFPRKYIWIKLIFFDSLQK